MNIELEEAPILKICGYNPKLLKASDKLYPESTSDRYEIIQ